MLAMFAAVLVVLAGCSSGVPTGDATDGPTGTTVGDDDGSATDGADGESAGDGATSRQAGMVSFYVSDEPNAIGDFAHLNVTVTAVGFHSVDGGGGGDGDDGGDAGESDDEDANQTADDSTTMENETAGENETTATTTSAANGSTESGETTADDGDDSEDDERDGGEDQEGDDDGGEADGSGGGSWVTREVSNVTVDLTRLLGANATRIADVEVPAGSYDSVFVYVGAVEATLATGETVRVKLPSEKLKLNSRFEVGANQTVDFVYDVAVHEAGKSGKYVLRPVVSESGIDVPIEEVGSDRNDGGDRDRERGTEEEREHERDGDDDREDGESSLDVALVGNATAGEEAVVEVTRNGTAVENATVEVNERVVGTTGADGRLALDVPNAKRLKVKVTAGEAEAELAVEFDEPDREKNGGGGSEADDDEDES